MRGFCNKQKMAGELWPLSTDYVSIEGRVLKGMFMKKENIRAYLKGLLEIKSRCGIAKLFSFISDYSRLKGQLANHIVSIAERYKVDNPGISFQKYLDTDYWLFECMRRCYVLGLHDPGRKLKILDVGTGAAYFPFVCKYYGHEVEAIDVPDNEMYNEIISAFGIKRYDQYIRSFSNLATDKSYDLITAFMICFNCHKQPDLWHIREWEYLLSSLHDNNLNPGGEVFLSFNAESAEEPVSRELMAYFSTRNAEVHGTEVHIRGNYRFK